MTSTDIRFRHDQNIANLAAKGLTSRQIAVQLRLRIGYVRNAAIRVGICSKVMSNAERQRQEHRAERLAVQNPVRSYCGSRFIEALPPARCDRSASDLARRLEAHRRAMGVDASAPASLAATAHAAGLTLEDIEAGLGIPPVEAVAAIRRAHHGAHP